MPPFRFEYEFRAPSLDAFWRCFFDPEHDALVDAATGIRAREVIEDTQAGDERVRVSRLVPERQLPAFVRKLVRTELSYIERIRFYRGESRITYEIEPSVASGRVRIVGEYTAEQTAPGRIQRVFAGRVEVSVPVIGRRIERVILDDMAQSLQISGASTQDWLDRLHQ